MTDVLISYVPIIASAQQGHTVFEYLGSILGLLILVGLLLIKPLLKSFKPRFDFLNEFMALTAYILKVDGEITHKEMQYVKGFIKQEFGEKDYDQNLEILNKHIERQTPIKRILKKIDYERPCFFTQYRHHGPY